jgi:hypothetical protein
MPRNTQAFFNRKQLIILLIAIVLALGYLLIRAERAEAQIIGDDYQRALTLERLLILGMLGLVVLTWFYLKWRPAPDQDDDHSVNPDHER